eukprot:jgi/Ulvmu1/8173/UM040_0070.1
MSALLLALLHAVIYAEELAGCCTRAAASQPAACGHSQTSACMYGTVTFSNCFRTLQHHPCPPAPRGFSKTHLSIPKVAEFCHLGNGHHVHGVLAAINPNHDVKLSKQGRNA